MKKECLGVHQLAYGNKNEKTVSRLAHIKRNVCISEIDVINKKAKTKGTSRFSRLCAAKWLDKE